MRIDEIDKNMKIETEITEPDLVWLNANQAPFKLYGVFYDEDQEYYIRMPQQTANTVSDHLAWLNHHSAGGRVRFRTNSSAIAIRAILDDTLIMPHMPATGSSAFDLYRCSGKGEEDLYYKIFRPPFDWVNPLDLHQGYASCVKTDGKMWDYTINFPLYHGVKGLYIALKKDAILEPPTEYSLTKPVVYYGSSITQGGCASRPGNSYQAILSRRLDVDHINLGFSGSCVAEENMVKYMAGLNMSVFVCDYDHNSPNAEHLRNTHLPLYRTIRAAQKDLPIIFISAPTILQEPECYSERREVIRDTYNTAVAEGDKNVYFIDGAELMAGACWDSCTVDGCHPNDLGFFRMAMRVEKTLKPILDSLAD